MRLSKRRRTILEKARKKELDRIIATAPSFDERNEDDIFDRDKDVKEAKEAKEWLKNL